MALAEHQQQHDVEAVCWFERNRASCGPAGRYAEDFDIAQRQLRGNCRKRSSTRCCWRPPSDLHSGTVGLSRTSGQPCEPAVARAAAKSGQSAHRCLSWSTPFGPHSATVDDASVACCPWRAAEAEGAGLPRAALPPAVLSQP